MASLPPDGAQEHLPARVNRIPGHSETVLRSCLRHSPWLQSSRLAICFFRSPQRAVVFKLWVITAQLLLGAELVVVGEIAEEEKGEHVVAEIVRVHCAAQLVGDAPEGASELFLVAVGHGGGAYGAGAASAVNAGASAGAGDGACSTKLYLVIRPSKISSNSFILSGTKTALSNR